MDYNPSYQIMVLNQFRSTIIEINDPLKVKEFDYYMSQEPNNVSDEDITNIFTNLTSLEQNTGSNFRWVRDILSITGSRLQNESLSTDRLLDDDSMNESDDSDLE